MARTPIITSVVVNSTNITAAIATSITKLTYTDLFSSGASSIDFEVLSNAPSIPASGQFIEVKFGYADTPGIVVNTGTMRIDDVVQSFRPNTTKFGAIALEQNTEGWSKGYSYGYQNFTLKPLIDDSASKLGLSVSSVPSPLPSDLYIGSRDSLAGGSSNDVSITGTEGRYRLLEQIARDYGYFFQVKGGILFFRRAVEVRSAAAIATIPLSAVSPGASFRTQFSNLVRQVEVTTKSGTTTTYTDASVPSWINTKEKIGGFYENLTATAARAAGFFLTTNSDRLTCQVKIPGSLTYQSGQSVNLSGFSSGLNQKYLITRVVHDLGSSGWTSDLSLQIIA